MNKEIRVFAPATVANVACGFDIFGFALDAPGDEVVVRLVDTAGVRITTITGDGGRLPKDVHKNTAGVAVVSLLSHLNSLQGVEIELHKKMPLGSGLGSSAASAIGSVFAVNRLLGSPLHLKELLPFAMESEKMACGSAHADNVAPSLLGGFVLIRSYHPLDVIKIPISMALYCAVIHSHIEIKTEEARKLLKKEISLEQHVKQSGNAAGLIAGLMMGDENLLSSSLQDVIAEPVRSALIPGFCEMKKAALDAGALGMSISGSGPSIFALASSHRCAEEVGKAMSAACPNANTLYLSKINQTGPMVLS